MNVNRLDRGELHARVEELADLLVDTVDDGASVGFLAPLDRAEARLVEAARRGRRRRATRHVGGVRRAPGGRHRQPGLPGQAQQPPPRRTGQADGAPGARGRGLGRRLLATAEDAAAAAGITLLHLDTETDSLAEGLYRSAGWTRIGAIPDYAAAPDGVLRPTSIYFKQLNSDALTR